MALISRREVLHAGDFAADASAPLGMTASLTTKCRRQLRTIAEGQVLSGQIKDWIERVGWLLEKP